MARSPESPDCVFSPDPLEFPDGRQIRIRAYEDDSVRLRADKRKGNA
ncbi:hypothetical protein ACH492_15665 [Streptomyces sp. NPDC019443]